MSLTEVGLRSENEEVSAESVAHFLRKLVVALFPTAKLGPIGYKDSRGRAYVTLMFAGRTPSEAGAEMQRVLGEAKRHGGVEDPQFRLSPWFQLYSRGDTWVCRSRISGVSEAQPRR